MKSQKEIIKDALLRGETLDQFYVVRLWSGQPYGNNDISPQGLAGERYFRSHGMESGEVKKDRAENILCDLLHPRKAQGAQVELESNTQ